MSQIQVMCSAVRAALGSAYHFEGKAMSRQPSEAHHRVISGIPLVRASLTEVVLLTLAVALGVNLISTTLSTWLPLWVCFAVGIGFGLVPIVYVARSRLKAVVHSMDISGFILYDREANALVDVPEYDLAEDAVRYLSAAFSENPALRRQWDAEPPMADLDRGMIGKPNLGRRLLDELVEYIVIDRLSMTLGDHFNRADLPREKLRTYSRSDLPDILLKNRFLELFSRDLADREGFDTSRDNSDKGWTLVSTSNAAGGYYHRFELTLPHNSTIRRTERGELLIEGPNLDARITAKVPGFSGDAPFGLSRLYVGKPGWDTLDLQVDVCVQVTVKRQWSLRRERLRYNVWIEDVLAHLYESLSGERFIEKIQWPLLQAAVQVFDRDARGFGVTTTEVPNADDKPVVEAARANDLEEQ
ncbi:hypothetical protein [Agromyces sp. NPDC058104]|uniref:hypothetical protein n=1 Tax=Agromyces sp. NPDC058104 TaxID=3346342 RepID=UPI0036D7E588